MHSPRFARRSSTWAPGLAVLRLAILAYRRWCSGRGPLRRVGCSFVETESCSAYGLRMAERSPDVVVAVARIRARLRRCRSVSIYRCHADGAGGREVLLWGEAHDEPGALGDRLARADELPSTRRAVLEASAWVCAHRGRWPLVAALEADLAELPRPAQPRPRILLRRGQRLLASLRRRALVQLAVLAGLSLVWASAVALCELGWLALGLGLAPLLVGGARVLIVASEQRRRFARLIDASAFVTAGRLELRPPPVAAPASLRPTCRAPGPAAR